MLTIRLQALWSRLSALTPNDSMAKLSSIVEVLGRWQQETQLLQVCEFLLLLVVSLNHAVVFLAGNP